MTDNVAAMLLDAVRAHGDQEAIVDGPTRLDYAALARHAAAAAVRLAELGVEPGDRVAILLPNGWEYVAGYLGIQLAGAIALPVNTRFTASEIAYVLADSGTKVVLTDATTAPLVTGAVAVDVGGIVTAPRREIDPAGLPGLLRHGEDVAQLLYTSGTTGRPKGAMQTHANLLFNAGTVRSLIGAGPGERTLIVAPLFHATGLVSQLVAFLSAGACCVLVGAFKADAVLRLLVDERITVLGGVAAMLRLMLTVEGADEADLSALRLFVMGGSPVPETFPAEMAARLPKLALGNVWGLTEATSIVTYTDAEDYLARPWSVGRAVDGVDVRISLDGRRPVDLRNVAGELCVRGPIVTAGYWANPTATATTYTEGWLHTGDVGSIDADGYIRVLDRLKDMIIRGGENIYSVEVENALAAHPDIAEVAVIGVPDPIFDERVRAVVVPRPGSAPTVASVREHAATLLADYKVPAEVRFAAALPRNPAGKVLKRRLAEEPDDVAG
ncbi:MAG TPA: AMP-binding protein [Pseudonocardiaceae bacterium]